MTTQEISLEKIDVENDKFRISEELDLPGILDSIKEVGQLNPAVLLDQGESKIVVCGFRRVRALMKLGLPGVTARVLPENCEPLQAFRIALWDNLSHRQLTPLETARVLFNLRSCFGVPDSQVIQEYMPLLGLNPAKSVLQSYCLLHQVRPAFRTLFAEGHWTHASLNIIAAMPGRAQDRLAALLGRIRLSASLQKKFLELLGDLAFAAGSTPDQLLDSPEILEIADDAGLSPFQRGERIYHILYRRRNPNLSQAAERFLDRLGRLGLPGSIRIRTHPYFEERGLHVEFDAADVQSFRHLAAELQRAAGSSEIEDLFLVR